MQDPFAPPMQPPGMPPAMPEQQDPLAMMPPPDPAQQQPANTQAVPDIDFNWEVVHLKLSADEEAVIADDLLKKIATAEYERQPLVDEWDEHKRQYEGRLTREDVSDDWESDIDIPITYERSSSVKARMVNPIIQQDPIFSCRQRKPDFRELAEEAEEYIDYLTDTNYNVRKIADEALVDSHIYPYTVVKVGFTEEVKTSREWVIEDVEVPVEEELLDPMSGEYVTVKILATKKAGKLVERQFKVKDGAYPEVCDPRDVIWYPLTAPDVDAAELICHTFFMSAHQIKHEIESEFFRDVFDKLKTTDEYAPEHEEEANSDMETSLKEVSGARYKIREIYAIRDMKVKGSKKNQPQEIIIWIDDASKTVLRAVYNFFSDYKRPFVFYQWEPRKNSLFGHSFCFRLNHLHKAISASVNQRLEAATLANAVAWFTDDDDFADEVENRKIRPGEVLRGTGMPQDHLMELKLSQPYSQLPELENYLERHADMSVALNQYSFGIEQVERPTATGQVRLIEEGQQPLFSKLEAFREFLVEILWVVLSRHKQFFPKGSTYYVTTKDETGKDIVEERAFIFPAGLLEEKIRVETKASTSALNKSARKQDAVALADRMEKSYQVLMGLIGQAATPSPVAPAAMKLAQSYQEVMKQLLDEFGVQNSDVVNPDLSQEVLGGQLLIQQIQQLAQQNQQLVATIGQLTGQANPGLPPGAGAPGLQPQGTEEAQGGAAVPGANGAVPPPPEAGA